MQRLTLAMSGLHKHIKTEKDCADDRSSKPYQEHDLEESCEDEDFEGVEHGASYCRASVDLPHYLISQS